MKKDGFCRLPVLAVVRIGIVPKKRTSPWQHGPRACPFFCRTGLQAETEGRPPAGRAAIIVKMNMVPSPTWEVA